MANLREYGEEKYRIVKNAVDKLMEHFDTVHIFVTCDPGAESGAEEPVTFSADYSQGCYYARLGQIQEWVWKRKKQAELDFEDDRHSGGSSESEADDDE